jgi:hypothetical protein
VLLFFYLVISNYSERYLLEHTDDCRFLESLWKNKQIPDLTHLKISGKNNKSDMQTFPNLNDSNLIDKIFSKRVNIYKVRDKFLNEPFQFQ